MRAIVKLFNTTSENLEDVAVKLSRLKHNNGSASRIVVITRGPEDVLIARDGRVWGCKVTKLPENHLLNTNGAGDVFAGAFLAHYFKKLPLNSCVEYAVRESYCFLQNNNL